MASCVRLFMFACSYTSDSPLQLRVVNNSQRVAYETGGGVLEVLKQASIKLKVKSELQLTNTRRDTLGIPEVDGVM